jgi:aryl-alcohol dehydrogenase-like predicted oxidoreductase
MIPGKATPEGTLAYSKKHAGAVARHWRSSLGLTLSSIGMGTYLGNADPVTDGKYAAALERSLELGLNVVDTASNYRYQRSEKNLGEGLARAVGKGTVTREQVFLCTKGGFLSGEYGPPTRDWFETSYVKTGILAPGEIVAGAHCMTPRFLRAELETSLRNLGVSTIDLYYVHNPETQLPEVGEEEYYKRLTAAFRELEAAADEGKLQYYGTATWHAYRVPAVHEAHASLERTLACAEAAGGKHHRFRAIQLPLNLGLPEALSRATQRWADRTLAAVAAAREAGLAVFTSVPLMQGQLLGRFGSHFRARFPGLRTDAQRCLQFARSVPGVTAPLVGMKSLEHVEENAVLAQAAPFTEAEFQALVT